MKILRSLRWKLTLAFLLTTFTTVLLVGFIARGLLIYNFSQVEIQVAFEDFQGDVAAYVETYGSWEAGRQIEGFGKFERRRRAIESLSGVRPLLETQGKQPPSITRPELEAADIPLGDRNAPPYQFLLVDPQGDKLLKNPSPLPRDWRQQGHPVEVNGQTVAFAIMDDTPNFNRFDQSYLAVINQALLCSLVLAGGITSVLGFFLAHQFSRTIHQLTVAVKAMNAGDLRQQVRSQAKDEVGILCRAFNHMSLNLAQAYADLERSHREIRALSIRDGLTQLYNRQFFNEQAAQLLVQANRDRSPFSVMIGDIDFFKRINDQFSHPVGDQVLREMAQLLTHQTREADVVARYGGEEFVIAFPKTGLGQAVRLCDRLRLSIQDHDWSAIHPDLRVTMSMGACAQPQLDQLELMIAAADEQLYEAKHNGRNQVCSAKQTEGSKLSKLSRGTQPKTLVF